MDKYDLPIMQTQYKECIETLSDQTSIGKNVRPNMWKIFFVSSPFIIRGFLPSSPSVLPA
jgi:hypothetical protein